ncbi:hypothetical protein B5X24_HaOG200715 [Helicoverpa armigera]|uniref:Gustatory receptor n=1 Tax=Helicoverpa armigera TaxID=29058 RepID=A0A2W1BTU2_HELAM|nr:hypothetical protein B5X24_HaOG200715 [Helicoverpa armigera]
MIDNTNSNYIDKNLQTMLFPLNLMQNMMFFPKYSIYNNNIRSNSLLSNFVSLCTTIAVISLHLYRSYKLYSDNIIREFINILYITSYFDIILTCIGFTINFIVSVYQSKNNVLFILKLQKVHTFLNGEQQFKRFMYRNWMFLVFEFLYFTFGLCFFCVKLNLPKYDYFCSLTALCFDVNLVYAIRMIKLLSDKVELWNIEAQKLLQLNYVDIESHCQKMFDAYVHILECYDLFQCSYQQLIMFNSVQFFFHFLFYLQIAVDPRAIITLISVCQYLLRNLIYQVMLSVNCERFYTGITNAQTSCALILHSDCTDAERRLAKNIKRLHRAAFTKMNACGIFYVDATLPLKLSELTSNYTAVLLQFAFL